MRADLQELELTIAELGKLTGIYDIYRVIEREKTLKKQLIIFVSSGLLLLGLCFISFKVNLELSLICFFGSFYLLFYSIWFILDMKSLQKSQLFKQIEQYNTIIKNLDTLDQLESIGHPISLTERERVIEALKINRSNLVMALQTERILRENPQFTPAKFKIDLTGFSPLKITEEATEYGRFLDEAVQLSLCVQDEMKKLERRI